MIPKSGRVLERNPITMEYYRGTASSQRPAKRGRVMRPRNICTLCGMGRSVKSRYKQELLLAVVLSVGHDPVRKLSEHSVYEQVGRRKLGSDPFRHGRFTIIVNRGFIVFIKQYNGTLYKLHPLMAIQYKIQ